VEAVAPRALRGFRIALRGLDEHVGRADRSARHH